MNNEFVSDIIEGVPFIDWSNLLELVNKNLSEYLEYFTLSHITVFCIFPQGIIFKNKYSEFVFEYFTKVKL